jgi:hypothetical protein
VHDQRSGLDRDVCFSIAMVNRFMKCDTPARAEWHGDNGTYSKLLAVGKHYGWLVPSDARGYQWSVWLGTRERRVRALEMWASR